MTGVTGAFFTVGFSSTLSKLSNMAFTNGDTVGDARPVMEWTHTIELQASLIADLDFVLSARNWIESATWWSFAEIGAACCSLAQFSHRLKAPRYFLSVDQLYYARWYPVAFG